MDAKRKNEDDKLEDGLDEVGLLQTCSPWFRKLRVAWTRRAKKRAKVGTKVGSMLSKVICFPRFRFRKEERCAAVDCVDLAFVGGCRPDVFEAGWGARFSTAG
jgi:hypothetical protein